MIASVLDRKPYLCPHCFASLGDRRLADHLRDDAETGGACPVLSERRSKKSA
jgi:hypothetical protein